MARRTAQPTIDPDKLIAGARFLLQHIAAGGGKLTDLRASDNEDGTAEINMTVELESDHAMADAVKRRAGMPDTNSGFMLCWERPVKFDGLEGEASITFKVSEYIDEDDRVAVWVERNNREYVYPGCPGWNDEGRHVYGWNDTARYWLQRDWEDKDGNDAIDHLMVKLQEKDPEATVTLDRLADAVGGA